MSCADYGLVCIRSAQLKHSVQGSVDGLVAVRAQYLHVKAKKRLRASRNISFPSNDDIANRGI
jgi:hypothetical protein